MTRSLMYPRNLFVYNAYWGTWSRVLQYLNAGMAPPKWQVEVNLTPVNGFHASDSDWVRVERITIREHGTGRDANDEYVADLPDSALELMRTRLPEPLIQRLLHEDFLAQIDWAQYRAWNNGGASFFDICK